MNHKTIICAVLAILAANQVFAQPYSLKKIQKVDVRHWTDRQTDSVIVFKEYTIDTIVGGDTVFFVQFWDEGWRFDSIGTLIKHCLQKEYVSGYEYKGLRNGRWQISDLVCDCFSEGTIATTSNLYYCGNDIVTFYTTPGNKHFFLQDTLYFHSYPKDYKYSSFYDNIYPDTINAIVTKDSFSIKLNDILFIKEETKYMYEVFGDMELGLYNRKLKMFRDSVERIGTK
ncbi:MAG: hypothetical protein J6U04_04205 [Salinivirgaceae bacterium]|nr:hypothetical protein [Salinivirgaceae bacterium]